MAMETFVQSWSDWLLYTRNRSGRTEAQYKRYVLRWLAYADEQGIDPLAPSLDDLQRYTGLVLHQLQVKAVTRAVCLMALRSFYGYLASNKIITGNPAREVSAPALGMALPMSMPNEFAERMLFACDLDTFTGVRDAAMLSVLLGTGIRVSGLVSLDDESLLFERDGERERLVLQVREKGSKERFVPVPDEARLMIRAYLGHADLQPIDRVTKARRHVLFVSIGNRQVPQHEYRGEHRRLSVVSIDRMIKRLGRMTGVPKKYCHAHAFRHMYGRELAENDVDINVRQLLLGHSKSSTTKIYDHIASRKLRREIDRANPFNRVNSPARQLVEKLRSSGL